MDQRTRRAALLACAVALALLSVGSPVAALAHVGDSVPAPVDDVVGNPAADEDGDPPLADAGLDQAVDQHQTVYLNGGGSVARNGAIEQYSWSIERPDGTTFTPDCPTCRTATVVPAEPGRYNVTLVVTDSAGRTDSDTLYVDVGPRNPPIANLSGPDSLRVTEGGTVSLDATARTHPLMSVTWRVDGEIRTSRFIDQPGAMEQDVRFEAAGNYTISATVRDESGYATEATHTITVANRTPHFDVAIDAVWPPRETGSDALVVNATVTNTGDDFGEQNVTLARNTSARTLDEYPNLSLVPGASETLNLTWANATASPGPHNLTVASEDDAEDATARVRDVVASVETTLATDRVGSREGLLLNESAGYPLATTVHFVNGSTREVTDATEYAVTDGGGYVNTSAVAERAAVVPTSYPPGGEATVSVRATYNGLPQVDYEAAVTEQLFDPYENITVQLAVDESETVMAGRGSIPVNATAHLVGGAGNISVTERTNYTVTAPTPTADYGSIVTDASNSTVPAVDPKQATPPDDPLAVTGTLTEHVVSHDGNDTVDVYEIEGEPDMNVDILADTLYTLGHPSDVVASVKYDVVDGAGNTIRSEEFDVEYQMVDAETDGPIEYEDGYGTGMQVNPQENTGTGRLELELYDYYSPINGTLTGSDTVQVVDAEMFGTMAFNRSVDVLFNPTWNFPDPYTMHPTGPGTPNSIRVNGLLNQSVSVHFGNNFGAAEYYYEHNGLIRSPNECGPDQDPSEDDCVDECPPLSQGGCLNRPLAHADFAGGTTHPGGVGSVPGDQWSIRPPEDEYGNRESLIAGMSKSHYDRTTGTESQHDYKKLNITFPKNSEGVPFADPGEYSLNVNGEYSTNVQGIGDIITSKGTDVTLDLKEGDSGGPRE